MDVALLLRRAGDMHRRLLRCAAGRTTTVAARVVAILLLLLLVTYWSFTWLMVFDQEQHARVMRWLFGVEEVYMDLDWNWVHICWNAEGIAIALQVLVAWASCRFVHRSYWLALIGGVATLAAVGCLQIVYRLHVGQWSPDWLSVWVTMLLALCAGFLLGLPFRSCRHDRIRF